MLLDQLKEALKPISELSRVEATVEVAGTIIHIRLLSPEEELACQQEAQHFLKGIEDEDEEDELEDLSRTKALRFLDAFRLSILSRAIIQVGDLDLRTIRFIDTGEVLENNIAVKITKTQAVEQIIAKWPRPIQVHIMEEFQRLGSVIDTLVNENTVGDFAEEHSEIADMQEQLDKKKAVLNKKQEKEGEDIRKAMRTVAQQEESYVSERINTAKDIEAKQKQKQEEEKKVSEQKQESEPEIQAQKERTPIVPNVAIPPPTSFKSEAQEEEEGEEGEEGEKEVSQKSKSPSEPRILQEQEFPQRTVKPSGMHEGVEVYRLPTQTLGDSPNQHQHQEEVPVSSRNPRFRSPKV